MTRLFSFTAILLLVSCTAAKVSVPDAFSSQADKMHVQGLQGWTINQKLSFGPYQTSKIKRGWDFSASFQYTKFRIRPEEALLKVFEIDTDRESNRQRNRFQYTVEDGRNVIEVYAKEQFSEKGLVYKSNNPWIGSASQTKKYEYAFAAGIVPVTQKDAAPWSLVLINRYDQEKDTARRLFDRPYVEEEGYATDGKETIAIRPLRISNLTTKGGRETKVLGGPMMSGYELQWDGGVVAIVDLLDNNVWIYRDLEPSEKLLISAISSALMLKRIHDVEKDKVQNDL